MKLFPIITENFKMDGGACFGVVPKSVWNKQVVCDENNMINLTSRCLLIETDDRLILIDTGMGNKQSEKHYSYFHRFGGHSLEKAFAQAGYAFDQVTDVILTHLHMDHVGGAVKWADDGKTPLATFPSATYYCSKLQWDSALNPNPREKASYFPENYMSLYEEGRLEFIFEDMQIFRGIYLEIKSGHTLGQLIPIIDYKGNKLVFAADFIPLLFNIPLPYVPSYDVDPVRSMQEKEAFLQRAADDNYILILEHDYHHECCTVMHTPKGVRVKESFAFKDLDQYLG